jgi:2-methylcitrate dehydratase PrpD
VYAARFSGPFVFARALLGGSALGIGLGDITENSLSDPELLDLVDKTRIVGTPEADRHYPKAIGCHATVTTHSGKVVEVFVPAALGTIERPMTDHELSIKFDNCISTLTDPRTQDRISAAVRPLADGHVPADFIGAAKALLMSPETAREPA